MLDDGLEYEELKITIGDRTFNNLDHYELECKDVNSKIFCLTLLDYLPPSWLEYENGEPKNVKYQPRTRIAKENLTIPVFQLREETEFLREKLKAYEINKVNQSFTRVFIPENGVKYDLDELLDCDPKEVILKRLLKQRTVVLEHIDLLKIMEKMI